uniref:Uncharacterized protein n=1 Tax=Aegilops tauschii subsp. strangulata TaxID=200361 RepID=A0A453PHZ3_AEGTS
MLECSAQVSDLGANWKDRFPSSLYQTSNVLSSRLARVHMMTPFIFDEGIGISLGEIVTMLFEMVRKMVLFSIVMFNRSSVLLSYSKLWFLVCSILK